MCSSRAPDSPLHGGSDTYLVVWLDHQQRLSFAAILPAGSIFDVHKRRPIKPLLYARAVSILLETAFLSVLPHLLCCNMSVPGFVG